MPPWPSTTSTTTSTTTSNCLPPPRAVPSVPAPGLHLPAPPPPPQPQPRTVKLTSSALLSLPYRLAHPPPAKSQVSSWGIVPTFDIKLDDILDRKHLPPLGLKDFEEWLLFVEHTPQDLQVPSLPSLLLHPPNPQSNPSYFILWLREYTTRYNLWAQQNRKHQQILLSNSRTPSPLTTTNPHLPDSPVLPNKPSPTPSPSPSPKTYYHSRYQLGPPLPPPPSLALFYARAKETFLTPNGPYELQVPSDVLSIFHLSNDSKNYSPQYAKPLAPPPDPAIFNELAHIIQLNLKQSLDRFVVATFNNVGTPRAHCGSVGGLTIGLAWSIPPLIASFTLGGPRWWRLIAFPGMWLGLTIFISAMYGVCMMIYVFGDLRQLRSFELSRPSISPPKPLLSSHSANPRSPALNAFASSKSIVINRERKGSVTREMISSPLRIPKAITRPPKAMVVERRLSTVTIEDKAVQGGSEAGLARPMSALVAASDYGTLSLASLAMDSASSVLYSEDEDLDEEYDDLDEEDEDEEDQGRDDDDDDEGEESDDEGYAESLTSSGDSSRKRERQRKKKARKSRPRIFISDALYDEHPSPEGPATASFSPDGTGVVWGDGGRRRLGGGAMRGMRRPGGPTLVRGSLPTPTSLTNTLTTNTNTNGGIPPLWPDYEANEEEEMNATATFIGGYVYEDVDFKFGEAECEWSVRSRSISMSRGEWEEDDLEAQMGRKAVARQPVGSFDFDALPLPPPSILRRNQSGSLGGHSRANTGEAEDEEKEIGAGDGYGKRQERYLEHQQQKQRRRVEMQSVSRGGGGGWRWRMLVYIQTKCGPGNAVSSQLRKVANDTTGGSGSGRTSPAGSEKSRFGVGWFGMHPVLEKHEGSVVATTTPTAGFTSLLMKMFGRSRGCENDLNVEEHPDLEKQSLKAQNGSSSPITWKQGFKKVSKVPAFAAPLTPVLNPVVGRAQWEIVVRSAVVSAFVSLVVVGGLVAVPVVG